MTRLAKVWLVLAVLFALGNLAGAAVAAVWREPIHAGIHAVLALLAAWPASRIVARRVGRRDPRHDQAAAAPADLTGRLTHLEHSVDALAIEVERIGEGQRFMTRVLTEPRTPRVPAEGVAAPTPVRDAVR